MSDKVLFQTDDALSEANLAARRARDNSTDYVERGLDITPDWTRGVIDVTGGHSVVSDGAKAYDVFTDPRSDLSLADSGGTNYVSLVVDPTNQDDVGFHISADGATPNRPSLLVAEVDAGAETVTPVNRAPDGSYGTLRADAQPGVADTFVSSTSELEAAFGDLSVGGTVRIAQPDTPYRPTGWLDVDTDDVTVVAESPFARDGQPLVKPADGSDVGGVRVGHHAPTEHVTVEGLGFHGNADSVGSSKRLHGFVADRKASHVAFRDNVVTRTSPQGEHNFGGSGFTVRKGAKHVELVGNRADDIGDHGIQVAGTNVLVRGNVVTNGFGHSIALDVTQSDGTSYLAKNVNVVGNFGRGTPKGSLVGFGDSAAAADSDRGYFSIVGNVAAGRHQKLAHLGLTGVEVKGVSVVGNVGDGTQADQFGVRSAVKSAGAVTITNNVLVGYGGGGIRVMKGHDVNVANNTISGVGGPGVVTTAYSNQNVTGNVVREAGGIGIEVQNQMAPATVANNQIRFCREQGIRVEQGGSASDRGAVVCGNALDENDMRGFGVPELDVVTGNVLALGNYVTTRGGSVSFADAGRGNLWVGNAAPADGKTWSLDSASGVRTTANRPNPAGKGVVLTSPDGTEYELAVDDAGNLTTIRL
jgi:hypothetical protein